MNCPRCAAKMQVLAFTDSRNPGRRHARAHCGRCDYVGAERLEGFQAADLSTSDLSTTIPAPSTVLPRPYPWHTVGAWVAVVVSVGARWAVDQPEVSGAMALFDLAVFVALLRTGQPVLTQS